MDFVDTATSESIFDIVSSQPLKKHLLVPARKNSEWFRRTRRKRNINQLADSLYQTDSNKSITKALSTKMRVSIIPQQTLLPQESVKLGRLITNYEYPYQDYHDPPSSQQPNLLLSFHDAYVAEHHEARVSSFGLTLTSLISARFAKHAKLKIRVNAEQLKTYALDNSEHWFEEVTRLPATRAWIERAIDKRRDIYLIVGFHTITNAKISQESARGKGDHAHIQASLAMSLVAAGVVMPLGEQINPTASLHNQNLNGAQSVFLAAGERVCAIEYRKVIHSWLSSKHIDRSRLSGVRQWPSMETTRDDEEDGEDDIVEVELAEMARPDGGWDIGVVDQDNILYVRG